MMTKPMQDTQETPGTTTHDFPTSSLGYAVLTQALPYLTTTVTAFQHDVDGHSLAEDMHDLFGDKSDQDLCALARGLAAVSALSEDLSHIAQDLLVTRRLDRALAALKTAASTNKADVLEALDTVLHLIEAQ